MRADQGRSGTPSLPSIACVELPEFPLQLLLRSRPEWKELPVALVESDRPQAKLTWVNAHAKRARILVGMRFAAARSLAPQLRAEVERPDKSEEAMGELFSALHAFSPGVEPGPPGTFWVDPKGLARLYGELPHWGRALGDSLMAEGFRATVVIGFQRWRVRALARRHEGVLVMSDPRYEAQLAGQVPLAELDLAPRLRDELARLEVHSLGQFMKLAPEDLRLRFGSHAEDFYRRHLDAHWNPLQTRVPAEATRVELELDYVEPDHHRLLFILKSRLESLLARLAQDRHALRALKIELQLDHAPPHHDRIEPATPTLDRSVMLDLLRLRLDALELPAGITAVAFEAESEPASAGQLQLFREQSRRDLEAGERALARIRAAYGEEAVTVAQLRPAHLPEASFRFLPTTKLQLPSPQKTTPEGEEVRPTLIRRVYLKPRPIPSPPRHGNDGWQFDHDHGPIRLISGPHRINGGWWVRLVERDYYYAEAKRGDLLWIFYDRPRRRWYLQAHID